MQNSSKNNNNNKILQASIDLKTRSIHFLNKLTEKCKNETKGPDLGTRWVRLALNVTNLTLFPRSDFSTF